MTHSIARPILPSQTYVAAMLNNLGVLYKDTQRMKPAEDAAAYDPELKQGIQQLINALSR